MPTDREWHRIDRDRADQELVGRAADWVYDGHMRRRTASPQWDHVAFALTDLLDVLAEHLPDLDQGVRWQLIEASKAVLGETMESPSRRRTREGESSRRSGCPRARREEVTALVLIP